MALEKDYLESLGLEIAKRKYYNAARVESVIEDLDRRIASLEGKNSSLGAENTALEKKGAALEGKNAALEEENAALRARAEALACGRVEIGDAILSARTIAQQLVAEAREQADAILAEARERAERLLSDAEDEARERTAVCEEREQRTVRAAQDAYLQLRGQCLDAVKLLDGEWQRFLCSLGGDAAEETLPADVADKLGAIAQSLEQIGAEEEA